MNRMTPISAADLETVFDIGAGRTEIDAKIMEIGHVPVSDYTSQERFEQERALFRRVWLNVARDEEVPRPGDWIVRDVDCLKVSILIARDNEGRLRAYHNICQHRGMKLVWGRQGSGGSFTCPYHAWRYGADGALKTVPDEGCFPHLDKSASALKPVSIDVWEGFVFIHLDKDPPQTLRDFLHPLPSRIAEASFEAYPFRVTLREDLEANWKLVLEGQSENYHIRALHGRTVSTIISSADNPFAHPLNWEALGAHGTYSTPVNPAFQLSGQKPVQAFAFTSATFLTASAKPGEGGDGVSFGDHTGFNPAKADLWGADQITVFPNFLLNVSPNGWWVHRFWPLAPGRTAWEATYAFRTPSNTREKFALEYFLSFNRDTLMEDMAAIGLQQKALDSGEIDFVQFGEQELACRHSVAVTTAAILGQEPQPRS